MDIYEEVTRRIVEQMEQGEIPWHKPWIAGGNCVSYATGKPYSLLNQMLLGKPGEYLTFRQCQQAGGHIHRGEKAHMVVFWKWIEQENEETGEKRQIPFLRYYSIFHINQCEEIAARHAKPLPQTADTDEAAERIISAYLQNSGVKLKHVEGDQACYRPADDSVTLPLRAQFAETAEYYSTAFHELTHSTGHSKRLNRLEQTAFFGSEAYSKEELIAEIGASALMNAASLETPSSLRNSAAYIQNWLRILKKDKRFIVGASGKAEKAVQMILNQ